MTHFEMIGTTLIFGDHSWNKYMWCDNAIHATQMLNVPVPIVEGFWDFTDAFDSPGEYKNSAVISARFKLFTTTYGVTPAVWAKVFNAHMTRIWHVPPWGEFLIYKLRGMKIKPGIGAIRNFFRHGYLLHRAHEDNQDNILPFIHALGESPKQLKARFGKAAWKRLCKNAKTRNLLIVRKAIADGSLAMPHTDQEVTDIYLEAASLPTTLLKKARMYAPSFTIRAIYNYTGKSCKKTLAELKTPIQNQITDVVGMLKTLGMTPKDTWSRARWIAEHAELSKRTYQNMFGEYITDTPFRHITPHEYSEQGLTATLLLTPYEILDEATVMHHCVHSFIDAVKAKTYYVYSVKEGTTRYATIGIGVVRDVNGVNKVYVDQCYGYRNAIVPIANEWKLSFFAAASDHILSLYI